MARLIELAKPVTEANFIRIKHGEGQEAILNTTCKCKHLVESVKRVCGCDYSDEIDLIGDEGDFLGLSDPDRELDYASGYLQGRAVYYAILVKSDPVRQTPQYVPLLKDLSAINPELALKLHDWSNPNAKVLRQTWKSFGKKSVDAQRQREWSENQQLSSRRSGTLKAMLSKVQSGSDKKSGFVRLLAAAAAASSSQRVAA